MTEQRPRFFFVHVMKTAGSTFRRHIENNFPGAYYPDSDQFEPGLERRHANFLVQPLLARPPEWHQTIHAYAGHFPFVTAQLIDPDLVTLTILRHPLERTISYLKHCKRYNPQHAECSFEEIYEDPYTFPMLIHNHQAKVFAMTREDPLESILEVVDIDQARLEIAKRHIQQVDVLGFSDAYEEFLAEMQRRYGWKFVVKGKWWESTEDWTIDESLRRRILADNAADIEFYEFARSHAAQRGR